MLLMFSKTKIPSAKPVTQNFPRTFIFSPGKRLLAKFNVQFSKLLAFSVTKKKNFFALKVKHGPRQVARLGTAMVQGANKVSKEFSVPP